MSLLHYLLRQEQPNLLASTSWSSLVAVVVLLHLTALAAAQVDIALLLELQVAVEAPSLLSQYQADHHLPLPSVLVALLQLTVITQFYQLSLQLLAVKVQQN
jgi:hypothetical protein